jgi:ribosomal protein S18 acetylase RimI-like enzyme
MTLTNIDVIRADYSNPRHGRDLCRLLHLYAEHETGTGAAISADFFDPLPKLLADFPTSLSVLAYRGQQAIGLVNAFFGFSTFMQQRLVNVHDVMVIPKERGRGVAGKMLDEIESIAREHDCCRITLEVLDSNHSARRAYEKRGFSRTPYHPDSDTLFLQKPL